jgi:hypothetical protein
MDDYARVKPSDFGVGSLLGMGWKEGDPIGLTNRKYVRHLSNHSGWLA